MVKRVTVVGVVVAAAVAVWVHRADAGRNEKAFDEAPFEAANRAMAKLKIDDVTGFNDVLTGEGLPHNKAAVEQMKAFREGVTQRLGKPLGQVELVARERAGTSLARYCYLEKYERGAAIWTVTFYRGADRWIVSGLDWGLDTRPYFQKAG